MPLFELNLSINTDVSICVASKTVVHLYSFSIESSFDLQQDFFFVKALSLFHKLLLEGNKV